MHPRMNNIIKRKDLNDLGWTVGDFMDEKQKEKIRQGRKWQYNKRSWSWGLRTIWKALRLGEKRIVLYIANILYEDPMIILSTAISASMIIMLKEIDSGAQMRSPKVSHKASGSSRDDVECTLLRYIRYRNGPNPILCAAKWNRRSSKLTNLQARLFRQSGKKTNAGNGTHQPAFPTDIIGSTWFSPNAQLVYNAERR